MVETRPTPPPSSGLSRARQTPAAGLFRDAGSSSGWRDTVDAADGQRKGEFVREGDYWTISFAARVLRLRDAKGLLYLAHLLRRPGQPVSVLDLAEQGSSFDHPGRTRKRRNSASMGQTAETQREGLERARTAVTKRIREAIRRIEAHDAALGHHL